MDDIIEFRKMIEEDVNPFDGSDYDRGQLEAIEAGLKKQASAILKILEALWRRNAIHLSDIEKIVEEK